MINYQEYSPCLALQPFIKTYYLFQVETDCGFEDFAYATGNMEVMFNMGGGTWQIEKNGSISENPDMEL